MRATDHNLALKELRGVAMPKVVSEKLLTIAELLGILKRIQEKRDLTSIEMYTLDYAKKFSKITAEDAKKAVKELTDLGVPEHTAIQIVNIMPRTEGEIRIILAPLMKAFTPATIRKMLDIINKYRSQEQ